MSRQPYEQFLPIITNWRKIVLFAFLGLVLALGLSLFRPLEYSAVTRIGITQDLGTVDAYTASRSAERIADNLAAAMYHSIVFNAILDRYAAIDSEYFGETQRQQRRRWERAISASVTRGNGLLTVRAYHANSEQAAILSRSVAEFIVSDGWRFSSGSGISMQIVDDVLVSRFPVRPNLLVNGASGFILGGLAGSLYILISFERLRRRNHLIFESED
jgi:capsular polysaccharide biosynthesis protein